MMERDTKIEIVIRVTTMIRVEAKESHRFLQREIIEVLNILDMVSKNMAKIPNNNG